MKRTGFCRILAACAAAAAMLTGSLAVFPAVYAWDAPEMTYEDTLPDLSGLTEIGSISMSQTMTSTGFTTTEDMNILDGAEVLYLYFPQDDAIDTTEVRLELNTTLDGKTVPYYNSQSEVHPSFGTFVVKFDTHGQALSTVGLYGRSLKAFDADYGDDYTVTLYRAKSNLPEDEVPAPVFTLEDALPDADSLKQVHKQTFSANGKYNGSSFPVREQEEFDCYYVYIPQNDAMTDMKLEIALERNNNNGGQVEWGKEAFTFEPAAGGTVIKINTGGRQAVRAALNKSVLTAAEGHEGESIDVYLYAYKEKTDTPPAAVVLESISKPKYYTPISETYHIENPGDDNTFSFHRHSYGFISVFYPDTGEYALSEDHERRAEIRMTEVHENIVINPPPEGSDAPPTEVRTTSQDTSSFSIPLENGRGFVCVNPDGSSNPFICTCLHIEPTEFFDASLNPDVDGTVKLPAEYGTVNYISADSIGVPYNSFFVELKHDTDNAYDRVDYAELTFRVLRQTDGNWEEFNSFTVGADLRTEDGYIKRGCAEIPGNLLKPDSGWLYIIEPKFYIFTDNGDMEEYVEGRGYAALCGCKLRGDLVPDGEVSLSDVVLMTRYLAGNIPENSDMAMDITLATADLDENGVINAADLTILKRIVTEAKRSLINE